jgi:hypothetical protein
MKGYYCPKCRKTRKDPKDKRKYLRIELHYEQIHGMRMKKEHDGKLMYHAWCPVCKEYHWVDK